MKLEVRNGTFGYGEKNILQDINFELSDDTVMTVLGPNGVGKTTLMKCIMGFLKWKSGVNLLDGKGISSLSNKEFWQKAGYVPQAKQCVFSYRVIDVVLMGLSAKQNFFAKPSADDYEKGYKLLDDLKISGIAHKYCNALSGGELQMVMIARALISEPELIILDEPESNLDMKNQLCVINTIEKVSKEYHTGCLINTHFPDHALQISDNTLMLGYGGKKLMGTTADVVTEKNIKEYFKVQSKIVSIHIDSKKYQTIFPYGIAT